MTITMPKAQIAARKVRTDAALIFKRAAHAVVLGDPDGQRLYALYLKQRAFADRLEKRA